MPELFLNRVRDTLRHRWRRVWSTWATRAESAAVVRLIAAAATAGVPAATLLDAWAEDSRGAQGTRLEKAVRRLRQGAKTSEAVAAVPGLVQEDHLVPLAYGERMGLVGPMIRTALAADDLLDPRAGRSLRAAIGYLTFVLILLLLITGFLAASIRPQLMRLLEEMGSMRPPVFESWQQVVTRLSGIAWVPFAVLAVAIVIRLSPSLRRLLLRPLHRPRRMAAAIDLVAVAIDAGRSPAEAAEQLAACQFDPRIAAALRRLAGPGSLGQSLASTGLVDQAEAAAIDTAGESDTLVMHRIAADHRSRLGRRTAVIQQAVVPAAVVLMGLLVLFQAVAVFSLLTEMIHALA